MTVFVSWLTMTVILVAFAVAGLVNANVNKVIEALETRRLDYIQCPMDTAADGLPIDPHIFGNGTAWKIDGQPSDVKNKVFCKAASQVGPGDICNEHAMLRALDTVRSVRDFY